MEPFGVTRSSVRQDHALITPDTHVVSPLVGWKSASAVVHISPDLGAGFTLYSAKLEPGARSAPPEMGAQRFVYVRNGQIHIVGEDESIVELKQGGYGWLPPDTPHQLHAEASAELLVIEKEYHSLGSELAPGLVTGDEKEVQGDPFLGDPDARLKTLLPIERAFDMAVNIFTYQPGATLPQVEVHVMEHGLLMLDGAGVYRLGEQWYPVQAGDVIWMAAFCPQWFVAMGKTPATYIYYKDIHRSPLL